MTTEERYQRAGWDLVRELLLLEEQEDTSVHDLTTSPYFLQILTEQPAGEYDERFAILAKSVLEFLVLQKLSRPELQGRAGKVQLCVETFRFEAEVRELQVDFQCSWLVAHGLERERTLKRGRRLGGFALLRLLLSPQCKAARFLTSKGIAIEKLATAVSSLPDSRNRPSLFALMAGAGLKARKLGHPVLGTDHLLLELVSSQRTDASLVLSKLGVGPATVDALLDFGEREERDLDWRADPEDIPSVPLPNPKYRSLDLLRRIPKGDERDEWAFVRALQRPGEPLTQSRLYAAIVEDAPHSGAATNSSIPTSGGFTTSPRRLAMEILRWPGPLRR